MSGNQKYERIYFDVGANNGNSMLQYTINPKNVVYAFEPTPYLINKIKEKTKNMDNYILIPKAVSNYVGSAQFFVAGQSDWGCSSLNQFNSNLEKNWAGRTDFKVTETINVDVIKLFDFINDNNISSIEYFHCDVQGSDLEVLMGMESHVNKIKSGVIEMPSSHDVKLYGNQKYIASDAVKFLTDAGFKIIKIEPNDPLGNEVNVHFMQKNL